MAQLGCEYFGMYKLFRATVIQSIMRSFAIIMLSLVLDDDTGFEQIQERLSTQSFVSKPAEVSGPNMMLIVRQGGPAG